MIAATDARGKTESLAREKGWIDALTCRADGALAWSSGKTVRARDAKGEIKTWVAPSSARGLAFFPKGYRVVVPHYNGASLSFPDTAAEPEALGWKGSHPRPLFRPTPASSSPRCRKIRCTAGALPIARTCACPAIQPRRARSRGRMTAAGSPPRAPTAASSGRSRAKTARWGSRRANAACARTCWSRWSRFRPKALIVAIGYDDGWVLLVRLSDGAEILVRRTEAERDAISALASNSTGARLVSAPKAARPACSIFRDDDLIWRHFSGSFSFGTKKAADFSGECLRIGPQGFSPRRAPRPSAQADRGSSHPFKPSLS